MNFDLSEEQEMFRSTVERFCAPIDVEARRKLRKADGGYDRARWQELAELGLIALAAGEDAGGMAGSPIDLALVGEALGKANAPEPWLENGVLPARILDEAGREGALSEVLAGEAIVALAWAERQQRYSTKPKQTKLEGGKLSGEKTFVLGAGIADSLIVTAAEGDGTVFLLIPVDRTGVDMRTYRLADGSVAGEVRFNAVAIDESDRLSLDTDAFSLIVADAHLLAAAELVGLGRRLLDDTLAYVKEREQFGVPIGSFQAIQHRLVECYARIEQVRSMLYRAALSDRNDRSTWQRSSAGAKAFIAEQVDMVAREAVQMHGGMGVTDELAIGHAMKRAMVLSRLFGDVSTALTQYSEAA